MKKLVIISLLFLFAVEAIAQVRPANRKHYEKFFRSTTYVVEDRDPFSIYNKHMKEAMEKHWKITPFRIISHAEFERLRINEDASFMVFADIKQKNLTEVYQFINFVMGDKKRDFESMPDLASVPLSYRDADDDTFIYKMGAFVKFMQTHAKDRADTPRMRLANVMNVKDNRLKNMELWLLESELSPEVNTIEKIQAVYPYKVRMVSPDDIAAAIAADRQDVAFLHKIGPQGGTRTGRGKCWKFIVSAYDGRVLFSSSHDADRQNPDAFLKADFARMAQQ